MSPKRHDQAKGRSIECSEVFDGSDEESWSEIVDWMGEHVQRMEEAFREPLSRLNQTLKAGEGTR